MWHGGPQEVHDALLALHHQSCAQGFQGGKLSLSQDLIGLEWEKIKLLAHMANINHFLGTLGLSQSLHHCFGVAFALLFQHCRVCQ